MRASFCLIGLVFLIAPGLGMADGQLTIEKGKSSLVVRDGDDVFTVFHFGKDLPKPYFLPVTVDDPTRLLKLGESDDEFDLTNKVMVTSESAPLKVFSESRETLKQGEVLLAGDWLDDWIWLPAKDGWVHRRDVAPLAGTVTRLIQKNPQKIKDRAHPLYYDHPHHKGVWLSVDEVNGIKFWNEDGRIENVSVEVTKEQGDPVEFVATNHWLGEDGQPLLKETTTWTLHSHRLIECRVTFSPASDQQVTFDDTKEGMFAIRLPNSMREMVANGRVLNTEGLETTGKTWGLPSRWIDYCGPVGGKTLGVTLMDDPANNPRPSRYHVRNYGLFGINPFGQKAYSNGELDSAPLVLKPGQMATFHYGLHVHNGCPEVSEIEEVYEQFVKK